MISIRGTRERDPRVLAALVAHAHGAPAAEARPKLTALPSAAPPSRQDFDTEGFQRLVLDNDWSGI